MPRRTQDVSTKLEKLCSALVGTKLASKIPLLQAQGGCPLVEDIDGDSENKRVTFFHDGKAECESANVCSLSFAAIRLDPDGISISQEQLQSPIMTETPKFSMEKLEGTNIWVLSRDIPKEARFCYSIEAQPGEALGHDPLNPISFSASSDEARLDSVLDLSSLEVAPQTTSMSHIISENRLKRYSISDAGILTERTEEYSPREDERMLTVHLPEEPLDLKKDYQMRLFLDGEWYLKGFEVPAILDDGTINIMLEPKVVHKNDVWKNREHDYRFDIYGDGFAKFLAEKLVPSVQQKFHVSSDASDLTICGSSLSGFAAMYIGLHHQEVFGNVLVQSAALWLDAKELDGRLLELIESKSESLQNSCFHLETSRIESSDIFSANHAFAEAMTQHGIKHIFVETCGEHGPAAWSQLLPGAVRSLQEIRTELTPSTIPTPLSIRCTPT
ncbi:MAG: hypothetical protein KAT71_03540 [Gammaproteobacteria bacterium]|nr:hypothetical protein [Gammaproteobacteria bacterium]